MKKFNPIEDIEDARLVLDQGSWPNFHDAEVHNLNIWRGDMRPDDNVWIGPVIEASFELCAIEKPYIAVLKFHDCEFIRMGEFNHQNALYELTLSFESRGNLTNGNPMSPYIVVNFEEAFGVALSFKCFKVQAIRRNEIKDIV